MNHAALEAKHRARSDFGNALLGRVVVRATFADDKQYIFRRKQAAPKLGCWARVFSRTVRR